MARIGKKRQETALKREETVRKGKLMARNKEEKTEQNNKKRQGTAINGKKRQEFASNGNKR